MGAQGNSGLLIVERIELGDNGMLVEALGGVETLEVLAVVTVKTF